jgi:hypothetical protein
MNEFPLVMKCSSCGKDSKRTDRKKNGYYTILGSFMIAGFAYYFLHWAIALLDWSVPFFLGLYWILKSERYVYHCKHCISDMSPYHGTDDPTCE